MYKRMMLFFIAAVLFLGVFSNGGNRVLDNVAVVNAIIFDTDEATGKMELNFIAYDSTASPKESVGKYTLIAGSGKTISQCIDSAQRACGKTMFLGHIRMAIWEESFAREKSYVESFFDYTVRDSYYNFYCTVYLLRDREKAFKALLKEENTDQTLFFDNAVKKYPIREYYSVTLNEILCSGETYALPLLKCGEDLYLYGMGIMRENAFYAALDSLLTEELMILLGEAAYSVIETPQGEFSLNTDKVKIEAFREDGKIILTYRVSLVCEVVSLNDSEELGRDTSSVKEDISECIYARLSSFLEIVSKLKADILASGKKMIRYYPKIAASYADNEAEIFNNIEYRVSVDVEILRNGVMY